MSNQHLTHGESSTIASMRRKNRSIALIAETLDRAPSSISRELRRNACPDGCYRAA